MSRPQKILFSFDEEDAWDLYQTLVNCQGKDLLWERSRQDYMDRIGQTIFHLEEVPRARPGPRNRRSGNQ